MGITSQATKRRSLEKKQLMPLFADSRTFSRHDITNHRLFPLVPLDAEKWRLIDAAVEVDAPCWLRLLIGIYMVLYL